jgi:hypothetical protein
MTMTAAVLAAVLMTDTYNDRVNPGKFAVFVFFDFDPKPERRVFPTLARAKAACDCINEFASKAA